MPRISSEAVAGEIFRSGAVHPEPPEHMTDAAKVLWRQIVQARPVDYFAPGSLELLEQFCRLMMVQRKVLKLLDRGRMRDKLGGSNVKQARELAHTLSTLATKLRLSIQSSTGHKSTGKLNERGAGDAANDHLLGGTAVWQDEPRRAN